MKPALRSIRDFLVSLKLTVALLAIGMVLVFIATIDQRNLGVWAVQAKYFRSFVVYGRAGDLLVPILPGGYLVGGLLLVNLIAGHLYRFGFTWRKAGIFLTHAGLILLLIGELLSGLWQRDYAMRLNEGETKNYAESFRDNELAVIDTTNPKTDTVVAIPEPLLARHTAIQVPNLPFRIVPKLYYPNSQLQRRADPSSSTLATTGYGTSLLALPVPVTYREDEQNMPSAFVELVAPDKSLGTYLVSTQLVMPQDFTYAGHSYRILLRTARAYYPFSLTLLKFSHDRYAGTDIPKNFSSKLRLNTPDARGDRDVLIYMNNPLRYAGLTFYQAGFENNDRTTVLQVVRNPSWLMPYISCSLMALGLLVQFGIHLVAFAGRRRRRAAVPATA
ncbi:MAG TPA: cytochrome c biogenesis protein ResB [Opitutaceae bacterium]|nr:cytochrome c biogenesis protein ResB [Opitutaceae bacterium]